MISPLRPVSDVIGREDDIRLVLRALSDHRLVTLVGPGGVGKTALALVAADDAEPEFARVVAVGLVHAEERGEVVCQLASAVLNDPGAGLARVTTALQTSPTLLVLDNCEQAIDSIADVTHELMTASPETRILATSRRPLDLAGELTVTVRPLPFPTDLVGVNIADFAAVQLFLERVHQADPTFELSDENAGLVASICARADGVPLVIELAAALVRGRRLGDIYAAMADTPAVIAGNRRDLYDHQRGVSSSLEWSRKFLVQEHRQALDRLSVFAGSFSAEAAHHIGAVRDETSLPQLVEHSLVSFDSVTGRYRLLEVIRADAEARLDEAEWTRLSERHLLWCQELAVEIGAALYRRDTEGVFPDYHFEIPNLGVALRRCWRGGDVPTFRQFLASMANWWVHHARPEGVEGWAELLATDGITENEAMQLNLALAHYWSHRGEEGRSIGHARLARASAQSLADRIAECIAVMAEANSVASGGEVGPSIELHQEALALAIRFREPYAEVWARTNLARLDPDNAGQHLSGALEMARPGFPALEAVVLIELSRLATAEGRLAEAARLADESMELMHGADYSEGWATALSARAAVAGASGEWERARDAYQEALRVGQQISHRGVVATASAGLASLPARDPRSSSPMEPDERLTERELAVASLLRGDLTQREIADELYIAPSTVKTHTKAIYRKLGVSKRSYAITRAAELGLFNT